MEEDWLLGRVPDIEEVKKLLAIYGLNLSDREIEHKMEMISFYKSSFEELSEGEMVNVLKFWNFLELVGWGEVTLKGKVKKSLGSQKVGWEKEVSISAFEVYVYDLIKDLAESVCDVLQIDKNDHDAIETIIRDYKIRYEDKSYTKKKREIRKICAYKIWESLDSNKDCEHWTPTKKKCLVHDLMSLCNLITRRVSFGIFRGDDIGNEVKVLWDWIKEEKAEWQDMEFYDPDEE